eukprot:8290255-Pyramimonas_sp.AAC.1
MSTIDWIAYESVSSLVEKLMPLVSWDIMHARASAGRGAPAPPEAGCPAIGSAPMASLIRAGASSH